jgi:hypothetical protein
MAFFHYGGFNDSMQQLLVLVHVFCVTSADADEVLNQYVELLFDNTSSLFYCQLQGRAIGLRDSSMQVLHCMDIS